MVFERLRASAGPVSIVVVLVAAVAVLAVMNVRAGGERERALAQRDLALARRLVAQSQVFATTDPRAARLLAVAAARIAPPTPETRAAIRAAVTRTPLAVLRGFPGEVHSVAFSPGGATLAATGRAAPLRLWDVATLTPVSWPVGREQADGMSVAYSPDGGHLAVAGADGGVRVWDTTTRQGWTGAGGTAWARQWTAFSPDGALLATAGGSGGASRLWDVGTGTQVAALRSLEGAPGPVAFSPDGTLIAAAYPGGPIRTFEAASGLLTGDPLEPAAGSLTPEPREEVAALAFSPGGGLLAGTTGSEQIQLWDVTTRRPAGRPLTGHTGLITSAAFSPDGRVLATAGQDHTVRLWDVRSRRPLGEPLTGHTQAVNAVAFSPAGGLLASAGADASVRLWRIPRGTRHPLTLPAADGGGVPADRPVPDRWYDRADTTQAVLSADAGRLVVQPYDGTGPGSGSLWSWDVRAARWRGERLRIRPDDLVDGVAVSSDGRSLAASGRDDAGHGLATAVLGGPASVRGRPLAYSPDGRLLATAVQEAATVPDAEVQVWTLPEGRATGEPTSGQSGRITAAAFDGTGAVLAAGASDGTVLLRETLTGRRRGLLPAHSLPVTTLAFAPGAPGAQGAPGGVLLLTASEDGTARLWDAATGRPHGAPLTGHTGHVYAVAFAPDGTYLATAGQDRTVRLWDTATGQPLGPPLAGHGGEVRALAFTADGRTLVAAAADLVQVVGDAYAVWKWDTAALAADPAATACAQAARPLTREEWAAHVPELPFRDVCRR
ncbi:WD40 repeat domain-containing protein [Nonomuraea gerenzanensis]|uniref:High-affnity carbon uptake protein Hat/HatR n=1 Tax=Nonomuraea gerenzanensis TaxID=93944 RepID=A0A1M4EAK2_9ACTN|nr:WD40 repeat domain-containing protein [Nonomuraea gerenzanensis]UBU17981.1 WD40 repeat domain-containing protein [Nonomuraea gerenzanensis]SBO95784.1 High-affnity carbon uptake protein Hat/HatR [Nonomuraea gerenzanensis]